MPSHTERTGCSHPIKDALGQLCARMMKTLKSEMVSLEAKMIVDMKNVDVVKRLKTIPAIRDWIYAWVGDVRRFRNARLLSSYAGLAPSVHQSGDALRSGPIDFIRSSRR
jgi:transposase